MTESGFLSCDNVYDGLYYVTESCDKLVEGTSLSSSVPIYLGIYQGESMPSITERLYNSSCCDSSGVVLFHSSAEPFMYMLKTSTLSYLQSKEIRHSHPRPS